MPRRTSMTAERGASTVTRATAFRLPKKNPTLIVFTRLTIEQIQREKISQFESGLLVFRIG